MEIQPSQPPAIIIARKLRNITRTILYMMKKSISKRKPMFDLHMMFKRGKNIAGKAIGNLMFQYHMSYSSTFTTCHSDDVLLSFVSPTPREYKFSCSNSPVYPSRNYFNSKNTHRHHHPVAEESTLGVLHRRVESLSSPVTLPGFGPSPLVRQLRVTDSPFPLQDAEAESDHQVDKDAEEFIKKFYKNLKQQNKMAALESPSPYNIWAI